jgi:competence protein ComEC
MTLGDRRALSAELKDTYAIAGASHVLALSGLHLGIIYALLSFLVHGRRWRIVGQTVLVAAIWAFALLVGLPASVVRAATMLSVCAVLSVGGRRAFSMGVLAFAAIVMLAVSPLSLFDVGFQLSFAAMFSILTILPLLQRVVSSEWLQRHRLTGWAWGLMAVSLAAQVGTAPLVAYYFGRLPLYFLLTNFLVVPAAYAILLGSLLILVLPVAAPAVLWVVETLNRSLDWLSGLPLSSIEVSHPTVLQVVCVYVAIGAVWLALSKIAVRPR